DGTSAGTWELLLPQADPLTGPGPSNFVTVGNEVFFEANTGAGLRLWVSDGTSPGTSVLPTPGVHFTIAGPGDIAVLGDKVLFVAGNASNQSVLWETDGTAAGLSQIPGSAGASGNLTVFGNDLLFTTDTNSHSGLWKTDGTTATEISV